jgi:hypothetical protein
MRIVSAEPSPGTYRAASSTSASRNASRIPGVTYTRDVAVQACPVRPNAPAATTCAAFRASSSTSSPFLPPISSCTRARRAFRMSCSPNPTEVEPVKDSPATRGSRARASPTTRPLPWTTLKTPAGRPASWRARARCVADRGVSSAGMNTTVLPETSAGAVFHAGMAMGKFHGVMSVKTPRGPRRVVTLVPGSPLGSTSPVAAHPREPKNRDTSTARVTLPRASARVLPSSRTRSAATTEPRSCSRFAAIMRMAPRAGAGRAAHAGWAAAAAVTAASVWTKCRVVLQLPRTVRIGGMWGGVCSDR